MGRECVLLILQLLPWFKWQLGIVNLFIMHTSRGRIIKIMKYTQVANPT